MSTHRSPHLRGRIAGRRVAALAVVTVVALGLIVASAAGVLVSKGETAGFYWRLSVVPWSAGPSKVPGVCVRFLWAAGRGQPTIYGTPLCIARDTPRVTASGVKYSFNLHAAGCDGVYTLESGENEMLARLILTDPRAQRVVAKIADGEVVRLRTVPLTRRVHRAVSLAWTVASLPPNPTVDTPEGIVSAVAYNSHGRVVGRSKSSC